MMVFRFVVEMGLCVRGSQILVCDQCLEYCLHSQIAPPGMEVEVG